MNQIDRSVGAMLRHFAGGVRKRAFHLAWEPGYLPYGLRPGAAAPRAMVTAPHHLSALAGIRILQQGGNAVDAAVALGLADSVVNPHQHTLGGEAVLLVHQAKEQRVAVVAGNTRAPRKATIQFYRERGLENIPWDGLLTGGVPATPDAWITALDRFGTLPFSQVAGPAVELAEGGYPLTPSLRYVLLRRQGRFAKQWPSSGRVYLDRGEVPPLGTLMVSRDLAAVLRSMARAEQQALAAGSDRSAGLRAARDIFYRGDIADAIVRFSEANGGLLCREDLEGFSVAVEEPLSVNYRGYDVYKAGPWCQGPTLLEALNLLEGYDLRSMPMDRYVHTVVEAEKLAFADREQYCGDPDYVEVPLERLLSKQYAEARRGLIDGGQASMEHRPGDPYRMEPLLGGEPEIRADRMLEGVGQNHTVHFDVVDVEGNMVSVTMSGGMIAFSPLLEGLGFALGTRLQMFHLDPSHPNGLMPGKRPRTALSPTLVLRDGRPFLSIGTPGGDAQEQVILQALVGLIDFDMPIQEAVERPMFLTKHFRSCLPPHSAMPGSLVLEPRIPAWTEWRLRRRGHRVSLRDWLQMSMMAIQIDPRSGIRWAGVDPRPAITCGLEVTAIGF